MRNAFFLEVHDTSWHPSGRERFVSAVECRDVVEIGDSMEGPTVEEKDVLLCLLVVALAAYFVVRIIFALRGRIARTEATEARRFPPKKFVLIETTATGGKVISRMATATKRPSCGVSIEPSGLFMPPTSS